MKIISLTDADLLAEMNRPLQQLHIDAHPDLFKPFDKAAVTAYFQQCLANDTYWHLGIALDNELAGFVQAQKMVKPEHAFAYGYEYIHIHQVSIKKSFEGKGVGSILFDEVLRLAKENSITRVDLTVWDFNQHAREFNRYKGFKDDLVRMYINL